MAKFVLVHGAFSGGWVHARVARILRNAGHDVYTPTLTGLGERSHLLHQAINLDTHIQDIVGVFKHEDINDAVLCGHSYGGMVITGAAAELNERVRDLVYIDAFVPGERQSVFDLVGAETTKAFLDQASGNGGLIPPIPAAMFNCNEADAELVDAMATAQPLATFAQGLKAGIDSVTVSSRTYVYAAANGGDWFCSTYAKLEADPTWSTHSIACGHVIMLDRAEELASLLLAASLRR